MTHSNVPSLSYILERNTMAVLMMVGNPGVPLMSTVYINIKVLAFAVKTVLEVCFLTILFLEVTSF